MSRQKCKFYGCTTTYEQKKSFYRFPRDPKRCLLWVQASQNPSLVGLDVKVLHEKYRVCEDHFYDWCFMNTNDKRLVHDAVPGKEGREIIYTAERCTAGDPGRNTNEDAEINNVEAPADDIPIRAESSLMFSSETPKRKELPSSRKKYTPRRRKLADSLKRKGDLLRKVKRSNVTLRKRLFNLRKKPETLKPNLIDAGVDEKLAQFIVRQIKLNQCKTFGKRYTAQEKLFAYTILSKSKAAYRFLRTLVHLPSECSLREYMSSKLSTPGLNMNIIKGIEHFTRGKSQSQNMYVLIFDEMAIKPSLAYDSRNDSVSGFENFGMMDTTQRIANQVLVLMIRSLKGNKKLPLGFYFSRSAVLSTKLKEIVVDAITKLHNVGVTIKAVICDQGANNCKLFSLLGVTTSKPFFILNNEKIYAVFDPPHLLKSIRRNFMKYDIKTSKGIISFQHIRDFYCFDKTQIRRCAPKLTDRHVYAEGLSSMKVSLAAQVFSNTVAASMSLCLMAGAIKADAGPTIDFIGLLNDLFDSVNGTTVKPLCGKKFHCAVQNSSPHISFWNSVIEEISFWEVIPKKVGDVGECQNSLRRIATPKCFTGWQQTLKSLILLYDELKEKSFKFLMPKRLNQDCLENFFSRIRGSGGNRTNPTTFDLQSCFKIVCINTWTMRQKYSNCEDDCDTFISQVFEYSSEENTTHTASNVEHTLDEDDLDPFVSIEVTEAVNRYDKIDEMVHSMEDGINELQNEIAVLSTDLPSTSDSVCSEKYIFVKENISTYIAGYVAFTILKQIDCTICCSLLIDKDKNLRSEVIYTYFKEYNVNAMTNKEHGLVYPTKSFCDSITKCMHLSDIMLADILCKEKVLYRLRNSFENVDFGFLSKCLEHKDLIKQKAIHVCSKLSLKIYLRELNRAIEKKVINLKPLRDNIRRQALRDLS